MGSGVSREQRPAALTSQVIVGDDDLAGEVTRIINHTRRLLTQVNSGLEQVIGREIQRPAGARVAEPVRWPRPTWPQRPTAS